MPKVVERQLAVVVDLAELAAVRQRQNEVPIAGAQRNLGDRRDCEDGEQLAGTDGVVLEDRRLLWGRYASDTRLTDHAH